jgi:hypothetical protein
MRDTRRSMFSAAAWVLLFPVLLGARCNPDPPACSADAGATPIACGPGEAPACLNRCMPLRGQGQPCDRDPCLLQHGVCANGLSCFTLLGSQQPTCQPPNPQIQPSSSGLLFCDSFLQACAGEDYCRPFSDGLQVSCANSIKRPRIAPSLADGSCVAPQREGQDCDSSWHDLYDSPFETHCQVCEPGLVCIPYNVEAGREGQCLRVCDSGADCPCDTGDPSRYDTCQSIAVGPGETTNACTNCGNLGEPCSGFGCCDAAHDQCVAGECCRPAGAACSASADCCGTARCGSDHTCHGCTADLATNDPMGPGCCSGFPPVGGVCPLTCFVGVGTARHLVAEGSECCGAGSGYVCDFSGGTATCTGGPTEVYNCRDDNCNGLIDDGADPTCYGPVLGSPDGHFAGCPNLGDLRGEYRCSADGVRHCSVTVGWCAWDDMGNPLDHSAGTGAQCFTGAGDCSTFACLAGEWCCATSSQGVPYCQELGFIDSVPIDGYSHPPACWRPGEQNTNLQCPAPDQCMDHGSDCPACAADQGCGYCESYHACIPGDDTGPTMNVDCGPGSDPLDGWIRDELACR